MRTLFPHNTFFAHRARKQGFLGLIIGFVILSTSVEVRAQTDWWTAVGGPYGGTTVWDLERLADGSILAATSNGVHRSLDNGYTWTAYSQGLTTFDVRDILIDSSGLVRVATFGHGLFSRGALNAEWIPAGLPNTYTTSLLELEQNVLLAGALGFVYRSDDGGSTWSTRSMEGYTVNVQTLATNGDYAFAGTNLGIFRSADAGATWEFASFGLQEYDVRSIASNDVGHLFAGVQPGQGGCAMYRSRGNGGLWTCIQPETDPLTVPTIKSAPDGTLFAGGFRHLYLTDDEGGSWLARRAAGSNVQSILFLESGLLIGTHGQGVLRSSDDGVDWHISNDGMRSSITTVRTLDDGRVVAGGTGGLFVSTNLGASWERAHPDLPLIQSVTDIAQDAEGRLLAATKAGLWRHDAQDGWSALGPPGMPVIRDLDVTVDGTILASSFAGVWLFSGTSWTTSPVTGPDLATRDVASVMQTSEGSLLAGASWDSWRRAPGEVTWQLMSAQDLAWFDVQAFAEHDDRILAGTKFSGVLQSSDDGANWYPLGAGLGGSEDVRDIQFDQRGTPYIATYGSGVYQLNPWSNTWLPVRSGLNGHWRVTSMAYDTYGNAWIGTVDGGLFRHGTAGVHVGSEADLPESHGLGIPWPNPSTGPVSVTVTLPQAEEIHIDVIDVLGRRVLNQHLMLSAGQHDLRLDIPASASGVYWIRSSSARHVVSRSVTVIR